jgi:Zn-dependent peptidase ImmA (M78 family)
LSDTEASVFPDQNIERWCDQVAAELLVPMDEFRRDLRPGEPLQESTNRLARRFKVSTLVILRRLFEAGAIANREAFWRAYRAENDRLREISPPGTTGGDFYRTLGARVSRRFEYALVSSALGGRTPFTEAFRLLGCKRMATFDNLAHRLGFTA